MRWTSSTKSVGLQDMASSRNAMAVRQGNVLTFLSHRLAPWTVDQWTIANRGRSELHLLLPERPVAKNLVPFPRVSRVAERKFYLPRMSA
jgi:hypothetical protein